MNIRTQWRSFAPAGADADEFFGIATAGPGAFEDFKSEAAALWGAYLGDLDAKGLSPESEVLLRFHLSDAANQAALLRGLVGGRPCSIVDQPPADGSRIALEAWHVTGSRHPEFHMVYSPEIGSGNSFEQTKLLFDELDRRVSAAGGKVAANTLRTWLYCRDIDNNYAGLVKARNEYFDRIGLVEVYLASTGIGGGAALPGQLVQLDALEYPGVSPEQIVHLKAEDHLSPTALYGVRFERGSRIDLADRAELFISGTASIDHLGKILYEQDIRRQCRRVIENIAALLKEGGAALPDVLSATVYMRDPADCAIVREEFRGAFAAEPVFLVAPVCRPGWLVECECIAVVDKIPR